MLATMRVPATLSLFTIAAAASVGLSFGSSQ